MKQSIASDKVDSGSTGQIVAGTVAVQDSVAAGAGGVAVKGNVQGGIQVTNKKIEINSDHGAVVNIYDAPPRVKQRDAIPQPPRTLRGFVNRVNELKRLDQIVAVGETVVIHGMDGMGKSALLKQTANSKAARAMPGGVVFFEGIDEHGQTLGMEDVIQRLFDKLFESEPPLKVNFDVAQTYLSNTRPLVILNGLNHSAVSQSRMADLFPRSAVLIESNQLLESDTAELIEVGPLPRAEAIELFAAKAGVVLDNVSGSILDSICALLADVPLAIVTAARAIRENNLTLERAHDILTSIKPPSEDAIRGGVERAYALAYSTLTELERQFLAAAALAPGISVDPHWLHHMLNDKTIVARTQEHLQAMGLLTANSPRLRIDPGLRDLARIGVDEVSIKQQLINHLIMMLEKRSLDWNYCADELGNILGMIDWAAKRQRGRDVISLGRAIDPYLALHGLWESWRMVIDNVLQSARQSGDHGNEAWALHQLGAHAIGVDQIDQAIDFLRQAFDLRRALGDTIGAAYTQHNLDLLIPPPGNGSHDPPDKPNGRPSTSGRILKFLWKAVSIGILIIAGGYVLTANARDLPIIPITSGTSSITSTSTPIETLTATVTNTTTPTNTPTFTITPTLIPIITATPSLACSVTLTGLQNANCRIGPSTVYDPPYGTLLQGQTVGIVAINDSGTWFMVDHPQSFRYPCWVWNGPAVQVQGERGCVQAVAVPPASILQAAAEGQSVQLEDTPFGLTVYPVCSLYPTLPSCGGLHLQTRTPILDPK